MADYGDVEAADKTPAKPDDGKADQPSKLKPFELMAVLKGWWTLDSRHCQKWHKQCREDFKFVPPDGQWTEEEKQYLEGLKRAPISFNRTLPMIKSVAGSEINSRHQVVFLPCSGPADERGRIIVKANETLSAASQWMDDTSDAEDNQSEAFQDMLVCGMGWSQSRVGYDDDPKGQYEEPSILPWEMYWDYRAKAKNLTDRQRHWHKRTMLRSEAKGLFPDAADEDLNCTWVHAGKEGEPVRDDPERRHKEGNNEGVGQEQDPQSEVTILHVQWWEHEPFWLVAIPEQPDKPSEMSNEDFTAFRKKVKEVEKQSRELGQPVSIPYKAAKARRKVYKQAFIGRTILEVSNPQNPKGFTFHCLTGHADKIKGTWFGLVSIARDPQRFANSVLSTTKHILDSTAKGGIIAEEDAFKDVRQAEKTYARPDAITWAAQGAISKNKIMAKPGTGMAAGYINLLDFAIASIRDVMGINLELLGMRDANQPGILEAQRKQAAMTILATLFDSLKRYRKLIGRTRLAYIQKYLADGRLMRISGEDGYQLVQLLQQDVLGEYEVIVSDAPTNPNQKDATWGVIQMIFPAIKDMLGPEEVLLFLEYAPLPTELVDALKKRLQEQGQAPEVQQQKQLAIAGEQAKVAKDQASAKASSAKAILDMANAAKTHLDTQLAVAQASIAATLAGQAPRPALAPDAPVIEPIGPTAPMPAGPPPMPAPAEAPQLPELPTAAPGMMPEGRVL